MQVTVTPQPTPLVEKPDVVFEKVTERLMDEIKKSGQDISVNGITVTMTLDEKKESLFAKQDLNMLIDRTITQRYITILDEVVNELK